MDKSKRAFLAGGGIAASIMLMSPGARSETKLAQAGALPILPEPGPAQLSTLLRHSAQFAFHWGGVVQPPRNAIDWMWSPTCPDCLNFYRETISRLVRDAAIPAGNAIVFHLMPRNDRDVAIAVRLREASQAFFPGLVFALLERGGAKRKELSESELSALIASHRGPVDGRFDPARARAASALMHEYGWKHLRIGETPAAFVNGKNLGKYPRFSDLRSPLT